MSKAYGFFFALALGVSAALATATPDRAQAQTAADVQRLNQAMALCNSPIGALSADCARLRGMTGGLGGFAGVGQGAGVNAAAAQQAYAGCITRAGVNQAAIAACNASLNYTLGLPQPVAGRVTQYDAQTNSAMNIAGNAAAYRQCIAGLGGMAGGINPCTPLLNGAPAGPGAPAGFAPPQAYNPPAPSYTPPAQPQQPFDPLGF